MEEVKSSDKTQAQKKLDKKTQEKIETFLKNAHACFNDKVYDGAISYCKRVLILDEENILALLLNGRAHKNLEKPEEALKYFIRILAVDPKNSDALFEKAIVHYMLNEKDEAKNIWKKLLKTEPQNTLALRNLSIIYSEQGQSEKASLYFKKIFEIDSEDIDSYVDFAEHLLKNKKYLEAYIYAIQAIMMDANHEGAASLMSRLSDHVLRIEAQTTASAQKICQQEEQIDALKKELEKLTTIVSSLMSRLDKPNDNTNRLADSYTPSSPRMYKSESQRSPEKTLGLPDNTVSSNLTHEK